MTAYNGLHNKEAMIGTVHNKWTVLSYSHQDPVSGNWYYNCKCICGNTGVVAGTTLRTGNSKQCRSCSAKIAGKKGLYGRTKNTDDLYIIKVGVYVKIGVSSDVKRRIKDIESACPYPVELLYHGVCEGQTEEEWHNKFKKFHHRGEWFKYNKIKDMIPKGNKHE